MGLPSQASDLHDSKQFSTLSGFKICCCEAGLLKAILFPSSVRACLGPRSLVLATRVSCGPIPCSGPRPPSPHPLRAVRGASHTLPYAGTSQFSGWCRTSGGGCPTLFLSTTPAPLEQLAGPHSTVRGSRPEPGGKTEQGRTHFTVNRHPNPSFFAVFF